MLAQKSAVALAGHGERLSAYRKLCCRYSLSLDCTAADPVCLAWQSRQVCPSCYLVTYSVAAQGL